MMLPTVHAAVQQSIDEARLTQNDEALLYHVLTHFSEEEQMILVAYAKTDPHLWARFVIQLKVVTEQLKNRNTTALVSAFATAIESLAL